MFPLVHKLSPPVDKLPQRSIGPPQRSISRSACVIMVSSEDSFLWTGNRINKNNISLRKRKRGNPWLVFHSGNATTAYNLLACDFLFEDFYILAVDIIGHPGKSAENSLPASGYDYGRWAGEVIDRLGFDRISLFGGSFGGERLPFSRRRSH